MLCLVECRFVAEVLVDIVEADNGLSLNPPVKVVIHMTSVEVGLVYHRPVGIESLLRGFCHERHYLLHFFQYVGITEYEGSLVHQP